METQIDEYYGQVLTQFDRLNVEEDKRTFAQEHQDFLNFQYWLKNNRQTIMRYRLEELHKIGAFASVENIYRSWNKLIMELFGEENLDDFSYREAISLGKYGDMLATRKLLSPVKWLSLIVNGSYNTITAILTHIMVYQTTQTIDGISHFLYERTLPNGMILAFNMLLLSSIVVLPIWLIPTNVLIILVCIPLSMRTLSYLANPYNKIIRPLAAWLNIDLLYLMLACVPILLAGVFLLCSLVASTSAISIIMVVAEIASWITLIATAVLIKKVYDVQPVAGLVTLVLILLQLLVPVLVPIDPLVINTLQDAIVTLIAVLSSLSITVIGINALDIGSVSELMDQIALPNEEIAPEIKQVVSMGVKANWSHRFFNTNVQTAAQPPEQAEQRVLSQE